MNTDHAMTLGQVARTLNVSTARVSQLAVEGRLCQEMTPVGRLFDRESVVRLAEQRARQSSSDPRVRAPALST